MAEWLVKKTRADTAEIARALNIPEVTAQLLVNRGMRSYEDARAFLTPELSALKSPFDITDVEKGVRCLLRHIKDGGKIAVYGDYDVDGVMSAVILQKCLSALGADYAYYVPDRENEGYGLNIGSVMKLKEAGVTLIIACDNGISSHTEADYIYENGMELVIIDHHEPSYNESGGMILPRAEAVIDPKRKDCAYPFKEMCAAGLCYRFTQALFNTVGAPLLFQDDLLIFAALATVCDIVDLLGDNRIIVKNGLSKVFETNNTGLRALLEVYELENVTEYHIGFILGPAINASGRLESARTAARLFMTDDRREAMETAQKLRELNISRRAMTEEAYLRLCQVLSDKEKNAQKVYVLYDELVHESIAGIVAGRIREAYNHPAIVISKGMEYAKGSARSVPGYNIFDALTDVSKLFIKYGGHAQAAGFSLPYENICRLEEELNARCGLMEGDFDQKLNIDMRLPLSNATLGLCRSIDALKPFGKGNREPLFAEKGVIFRRIDFIGKEKKIVKLWSRDFPLVTAISFNGHDKFLELARKKAGTDDKQKLSTLTYFEMDIAFTVSLSEYRGECSVTLILKDFR